MLGLSQTNGVPMRSPVPLPTRHPLATTAVGVAAGVAAGVALAAGRRKKRSDGNGSTLPDDPAWHAALHGKHPPKVAG